MNCICAKYSGVLGGGLMACCFNADLPKNGYDSKRFPSYMFTKELRCFCADLPNECSDSDRFSIYILTREELC
jgi:hypothetical protein